MGVGPASSMNSMQCRLGITPACFGVPRLRLRDVAGIGPLELVFPDAAQIER